VDWHRRFGQNTGWGYFMPITKGIQSHKIFKLGKAPAKRDERNLKMAAILRAPVPFPPEYDFDLTHSGIPTPMFRNDELGCCVIAGRAHQTLRFELLEQGAPITITDKEVEREYFKESGGEDSGLVVLDSLNLWRRKGWTAAKQNFKIKAFAEIDRQNHDEVMSTIFLDVGTGIGVSLPKSAQAQIQAGKPWDAVDGPNGKPNSWGGHYVFIPGYTSTGPVCVTWGRKQQMTWAFWDKYCDEAYAIIDAVNTPKKKKAIDAKAVNDFLSTLN
jgi:hypothetical protein